MSRRRKLDPLWADVERKLGAIVSDAAAVVAGNAADDERAARLAAADPQFRDGVYTVHVDHLRVALTLLDKARRERDEAHRDAIVWRDKCDVLLRRGC